MFSPEGLAAFRDGMQGLVDDGTVPGVVTLLAQGDEVHIDAVGVGSLASGAPMRDDAIVRIQSMTKPILAAATMRLVERGDVRLDDPVERWLPELANRKVLRTPTSELDDVVPARRPITVDDLLTCRSGYGMVIGESPIVAGDGGARRRRRSLVPSDAVGYLAGAPRGVAADPPAWRGVALPHLVRHPRHPALARGGHEPGGSPAGERSSTRSACRIPRCSSTASARSRLVAVYHHDENGALVEDEPAGGGYHVGYPPYDISRGELVSTARDYHRFATMLMRGGELDGVRLLSPESIATMTRDHIDPAQKTPDSFFPGFWDTTGWGYGMGILTAPRRLRRARPLQLVGRLRHRLVQRPEHRADRHRPHAGPARRPDDGRHRHLLPCRLRHDHDVVMARPVSTRM